MKYRQIKTDFWDDGYILDLTPQEKLLFIYLFTNPKVNMTGIYELPDRTIRYTLGATLEELEKMKKKFQDDGKYSFHNGWVYINNFTEHNRYSPAANVVRAFIKDFNAIPQEILKHFLVDMKFQYIAPIEKENRVMVMVMVMDKEGSPYPSPYPTIEAKVSEEFIDVDEIINGMEKRP